MTAYRDLLCLGPLPALKKYECLGANERIKPRALMLYRRHVRRVLKR